MSRRAAPARRRRSSQATAPQPSFDFDAMLATTGNLPKAAELPASYRAGPTQAIAEHLKARPGWHAKSDILAATGIPTTLWNAAIANLIAEGKVERQGKNVALATVRLARPLEFVRRAEKTGPKPIERT